MTPSMRALRWIFLAVGLLLLAGSGYAIVREMEFRQGAIETDGQVVEMLPRSSRDGDGRNARTYAPVFVFALPDGTKQRVEGTVATNPPCCTVGETIRVRYRPEAPERAQMAGFMQSWFVATLLGGMGAVFAVIGAAIRGARRPQVGAAVRPIPAPASAVTFAVPLAGLRRGHAGGGPQWFLQARWSDPRSGMQRLFESPPIPFDPVPQMRSMNSVQVAFDPGDPNGPYAMDLSFLRVPQAEVGPVRRG